MSLDETINGLKHSDGVEVYWDSSGLIPCGKIEYNPNSKKWEFNHFILEEDIIESTPMKLVLRCKLSDVRHVKIIINASIHLTQYALDCGIRYICHVYQGEPGNLFLKGELYIFSRNFT